MQQKNYVLAIDGSNIAEGGGLTHLKNILAAVSPSSNQFNEVHVWCNYKVSKSLPSFPWLVVHSPTWCQSNLLVRTIYRQFTLSSELKRLKCSALLSLDGILPKFCSIPMVVLSQNMLPFQADRANLFGRFSFMRLKMFLLRLTQCRSFRVADGAIFLTEYARDGIRKIAQRLPNDIAVIPHGIEDRFFYKSERSHRKYCKESEPLQLLYVSIQMPYKHHFELMEAVSELRSSGVNISLKMIGRSWGWYGEILARKRAELDPFNEFIFDIGEVDFEEIQVQYESADLFVFPSSCENMPNILLEAMAAELPVVCSNRGPMFEILKGDGLYFDPESVESMKDAIHEMVQDDLLRAELSKSAKATAQRFKWDVAAQKTLDFMIRVVENKTCAR